MNKLLPQAVQLSRSLVTEAAISTFPLALVATQQHP